MSAPRVGQRVWLKAVPEEGWERQRATVLEVGRGMVAVRVDVLDDPSDDGIREVSVSQLEGR